MANSIYNISCSEEKVAEAFGIVRHTLEKAHQMGKVELQTKEIRKAIETTDYDYCFDTAQKVLTKYRKMINSYTVLTGVSIIDITLKEARSMNIMYWQSTLKFTEMLIYANEAIECGLNSVIEEELQKLFLSKNEIGVINNG